MSEDRSLWQCAPAGAGPRSYVGNHFAMLEAVLALAAVLGQAEIAPEEPHFPMVSPFTTATAKPLRARVDPQVRRDLAHTRI